MMRASVTATLVVAGAIAFGGRMPHAQPSTADRAVPFTVGELLTYDVSWSTYLTAGTATVSVKARRALAGGRADYDLVAEGRPSSLLDKLYHVYYKAESFLDTRTLQPSIATVFSDERGRNKLRTTRFTGGTAVEFEPKTNAPWEKHTAPPLSQDPLSAIYVIRAIPLKAGQAFVMPIVDGSDVYNIHWQIAGPEPVTTPLGTLPAWRVTPALSDAQNKPIPNKRVTLWVSNDAQKLPLKVQVAIPVGTFVLTLARVTH
jgi:hypothetical protein